MSRVIISVLLVLMGLLGFLIDVLKMERYKLVPGWDGQWDGKYAGDNTSID